MVTSKLHISIIILNYKVPLLVRKCIESIYKNPPKVGFEIIVVDNDEEKSLNLNEEFPKVVYVPTRKNIGFGAGFNKGVEKAKGKFILFLNPDTEVTKNVIDELYLFLIKNKNLGMASSILINERGKVNPLCATDLLTPKRAFFLHSFLRKLFVKTKTVKDFYVHNYKTKEPIYKDAVQTACFMMSKEVFEKIGRFDEQFFLFFEEYDFSQKLRKHNLKSVIIPTSVVIHKGGESMKQKKNTKKDFEKSRYLYFKKYYGFATANILDFFLRVSFWSTPMVFILGLASFLVFYKLPLFMVFISDQGWFYNSAKDMVISGTISINESAWTYILAILFSLFGFDPIIPGFFTAGMFVATVFLAYLVGKTLFSRPVGTVSALLYATSPLVIISSRMPYATSLVPFFTLLFLLCMYKFIQGKKYFFPISLFLFFLVLSLTVSHSFLTQSNVYIQRLVFLPNQQIAMSLFILVLIVFSVLVLKDIREKKAKRSELLIGLFTSIFLLSYLLNKTPSEAYWHLFFPLFFLCFGYVIVRFSKTVILSLIFTLIVLMISVMNATSLVENNYLLNMKNGYGIPFSARMEVAEILTQYAHGRAYNLVGKRNENYSYITWYLGNGPSLEKQELMFKIIDSYNSVSLDIRDENK